MLSPASKLLEQSPEGSAKPDNAVNSSTASDAGAADGNLEIKVSAAMMKLAFLCLSVWSLDRFC